uniref:Uncharacterized protein n=2 Tax=Corvus moneduloides TaxID=1196302 RepID=A0A8C3DVK4_CORMO
MKQSYFPSCCQLMKHLSTPLLLEMEVKFISVKKKSPCASVKPRLSNFNNILNKNITKEKFGVVVTDGKWRNRRKKEIKHLARLFVSTETGGSQDPTTAIMVTLPLLLLFILLPCSKSQEDFLDQHQKWNYREGADKVNIEGVNSITQTLEKWGNNIFWQMKHTLLNNPNALLPEFSSLRPVSAAVDNLVREVQSIRKRLEELNERLNVISKTVLPLRLNALQSQRRGNTQLRRLPVHRRRLYARRRPQST